MRLAAALACAGLATSASAQMQIMPPDPFTGESFVVVDTPAVPLPYPDLYCGAVSVPSKVDGAVVTLSTPTPPNPAKWCRFGSRVDGLAEAGTYTIRYVLSNAYYASGETPLAGTIVTVRSGSPAAPAYRDLDGNWFNPEEPGWGVNMVQGQSGALFAVLLTYEATWGQDDGSFGFWLVMSDGRWVSPTQFRGPLYYARGTPMNEGWYPPSLKLIPVGYLSLTFTSQTEARLDARYLSMGQGVWVDTTRLVRRFEF